MTFAITTTVVIPDVHLNLVLHKTLGIPIATQLTTDDLSMVTILHAGSQQIVDLTGMQYCVNLVDADFSRNQIETLSPLRGLAKQRKLNISYNAITELSPIGYLKNLQWLALDGVTHSRVPDHLDLTPLENLGKLTYLSAAANHIKNVKSIITLTQLETLIVDQNSLDNQQAASLGALTNLTHLDIGEATFDNADFVGLLTKLSHLRLHASREIQNIGFLTKLEKLVELSLANCVGVIDFSPLSGLTSLTRLELESSSIRDCSILSELINLKYLNFNGTATSDIDFLSNMKDLQQLSFQGNRVRNILAIGGLHQLIIINAGQNVISDISPLANLPFLLDVEMSYNRITSLAALLTCTKLRGVFVDYNYLTDVDEMDELQSRVESTSFTHNYYFGVPWQNAFRAVDLIDVAVGEKVKEFFTVFFTEDGITYSAPAGTIDPDGFKYFHMQIADPSIAQGILQGVEENVPSLRYEIQGLAVGTTTASIHFRPSPEIDAVMPFTSGAGTIAVSVTGTASTRSTHD